MRRTKAFSFDDKDMLWIKRLEREAARRSPRVSQSQLLVEMIRDWFEHKKLVLQIQNEKVTSLKEVIDQANEEWRKGGTDDDKS